MKVFGVFNGVIGLDDGSHVWLRFGLYHCIWLIDAYMYEYI